MSWRQEAACRGLSPSLFFSDDQGNYRAARQVCRDCPVRFDCLEENLKEEDGFYGGLSPRERRLMIRRRRENRRQTLSSLRSNGWSVA